MAITETVVALIIAYTLKIAVSRLDQFLLKPTYIVLKKGSKIRIALPLNDHWVHVNAVIGRKHIAASYCVPPVGKEYNLPVDGIERD